MPDPTQALQMMGGGAPAGMPAGGGMPGPPPNPMGAAGAGGPPAGMPGQPMPQQQMDPRKAAIVQMMLRVGQLNRPGFVNGIKKDLWSALDPQTQDMIKRAPINKKLMLDDWLKKHGRYQEAITPGKKFDPKNAVKVLEGVLETLNMKSGVEEPGASAEKDEQGSPVYPTGSLGNPSIPSKPAGVGILGG